MILMMQLALETPHEIYAVPTMLKQLAFDIEFRPGKGEYLVKDSKGCVVGVASFVDVEETASCLRPSRESN